MKDNRFLKKILKPVVVDNSLQAYIIRYNNGFRLEDEVKERLKQNEPALYEQYKARGYWDE